jgi:hypothetical protein
MKGGFQTEVPLAPRVAVYKVQLYDPATDDNRVSRRMATRNGAAKMGGEIVPETEILITADQLESGEEWTARDFAPPP